MIVWSTAGAGTPILFALEQVGVHHLDRPAIALTLSPPLPYLLALLVLSVGAGLQRLSFASRVPHRVRRALAATWVGAGLILTAVAPLTLYAEHATADEPYDGVHLALWLSTWAWWSLTASGIAVAVALRGHATIGRLSTHSRVVAGAAVGVGLVSLSFASVVVVPAAVREPIEDLLPPLEFVAAETETVVLALSGSQPVAPPAAAVAPTIASDDEDQRYSVQECLEVLAALATEPAHLRPFATLQRTHPAVDVSDIASDTGIEICEGRPLRAGRLGGLHYDATRKRVASEIRDSATARRNEANVELLHWSPPDTFRRSESADLLACLMEGLSPEDQAFFRAVLAGDGPAEVALRRGISREAAAKAWFRAKTRARLQGPRCGVALP